MPKIDWFAAGWTYTGSAEFWAEPWDSFSEEHKAQATIWAWDQWIIASCAERNRGHAWWLDWDQEDGLWLHCRHCPAGVDELYPDGQDLIFGELPLLSGQTLNISGGGVDLNAPVQSYSGPVRARVQEENHYSWEYGAYEYDAWVLVEAE